MAVQPAYIQSHPQHQMLPAQPVPAQMPNMTMSTPVGTRVSMRANKGQTSKYDDFLQQITLKPGTYASDGNNLYMLEDIGNTSSMRNLLTTFPTWQQKINQTWSPDTAYIQQLACDSHLLEHRHGQPARGHDEHQCDDQQHDEHQHDEQQHDVLQ
jgi:hypothetical protein